MIIDLITTLISDGVKVLVKQIRKKSETKQLQSDTDVKQLLRLIDLALAKESGLMAYCD